MEKLDEKSATQFISALTKSVQALCHGYLNFHNGIEIIGHINLSVDKESSLHYILEEKVCKSEENATTFISNSFYAQKAETQMRNSQSSGENVSSESKSEPSVYSVNLHEVSRLSPAVSDMTSTNRHEKTQSASTTSSASETDLLSQKTAPTPAKRKPACESALKTKSKTFLCTPKTSVSCTPLSPHRLGNVSRLEDRKPSTKEVQVDTVSENCLPSHDKTKDMVNDVNASLVGSVPNPVSVGSKPTKINSEAGRQGEVDSDCDLDVVFIKKEVLDEELDSCLSENSSGFQHGMGVDRKVSSSSSIKPDNPEYSASHPSHATAASSTYIPRAHTGLDLTTPDQLYAPFSSCSLPLQGTSFGSGVENGLSGQLGLGSHMGFMLGQTSFTPPLAHHTHSSLAHPASLGLSVLDLSIKTEPKDTDFVLFNCESRAQTSPMLFRARSEESRKKAKERSKEYRLKQKIHRMTDSTYDMAFREQVAERKRRQRMRERIKKLKLHTSLASYSLAK